MPKTKKRIFLEADKVCHVRKALGVKTDTEAIDQALNVVLANADKADVHNKIVCRGGVGDINTGKF